MKEISHCSLFQSTRAYFLAITYLWLTASMILLRNKKATNRDQEMNNISCNCLHNKSNSQRKIAKINAKIDIDNLPNTHRMLFKPHLTCTEESTF